MKLHWHTSASADGLHNDQEAELHDTGGAVWAAVTAPDFPQDGECWSWAIYARWLWDDIDADPANTLATGCADTEEAAKAFVQEWVDEQGS